jgi:hypothetical protein
MAKLTCKLWLGIGAATIASASATGTVAAQEHKHPTRSQPAAPEGSASDTPFQGGEAYLRDGGPPDTRIRFYGDIELIRGHLLVGGQLIELGLWDEALPHFLHPMGALYAPLEKYIKLHSIPTSGTGPGG